MSRRELIDAACRKILLEGGWSAEQITRAGYGKKESSERSNVKGQNGPNAKPFPPLVFLEGRLRRQRVA